MKQHITEEQFNQLNEDVKSRWFEFCRKNKYVLYDHGGSDFELKDFPSIGEMIAFIEDNNPEWRGINAHHMPGGDYSFPTWMIMGNYAHNYGYQPVLDPELADCLWQVCVEILNKNEKSKKT